MNERMNAKRIMQTRKNNFKRGKTLFVTIRVCVCVCRMACADELAARRECECEREREEKGELEWVGDEE